VMEGSPAEKAGLQSGDVIVRFNNEEITSVRKLTRLLGEVAPDHQAKLTVLRNGTEREITATLAKRPAPKFEEGSFRNLPQIERSVPWPPSVEMPPLPPVQSIPSTPGAPEPFSFRFGSSRKIGVGVTALTKQLSEHFGVSNGLLINEVRADSPAYKAGLKAGDIIIEVDGKEVKGEIDLITAIAEKKDGDVTLTIVRDRNRQTVRVTPEEVTIGTDSLYVLPQPPETDGSGSFSWGRPSFPKLFPNGLFPAMQFPSRIH
jgi:serine protease Do